MKNNTNALDQQHLMTSFTEIALVQTKPSTMETSVCVYFSGWLESKEENMSSLIGEDDDSLVQYDDKDITEILSHDGLKLPH